MFLKVDVDECRQTAVDCQVTAMPTFQFYKSGKKLEEFKGANADLLQRTIEKHKTSGGGSSSSGGGGGYTLGGGSVSSQRKIPGFDQPIENPKPEELANRPRVDYESDEDDLIAVKASLTGTTQLVIFSHLVCLLFIHFSFL